MSTRVRIDGKDVLKASEVFRGLEVKDQRNIMMTSYRKGLTPLVNVASIAAPKKTLGLSLSFGMEDLPAEVAVLAGSRTNTANKVWYAHLVEMGSWKTGERHWRRRRLVKKGYYKGQYRGGGDTVGGGKSTGVMPASHFWSNALNATESQTFEIAAKEWYDEIERYLKTNK